MHRCEGAVQGFWFHFFLGRVKIGFKVAFCTKVENIKTEFATELLIAWVYHRFFFYDKHVNVRDTIRFRREVRDCFKILKALFLLSYKLLHKAIILIYSSVIKNAIFNISVILRYNFNYYFRE